MTRSALAAACLLALAGPSVHAQYGVGIGLADPNNPAHRGRIQVDRSRAERDLQERARELARGAAPVQAKRNPNAPKRLDDPTNTRYMADNVAVWELEQQGTGRGKKVFTSFEEQKRRIAAGGTATADPAQTAPAASPGGEAPPAGNVRVVPPGSRRPRKPPGLRTGGRELRTSSTLVALRDMQRRAAVRSRLEELKASGARVDGLALVREALEAAGIEPPTRDQLETAGAAIDQASADAGDLAFFRFGEGDEANLHVAVVQEGPLFAYPTRNGVKQGDLRDARWSKRLVEVRRLRP